MDNTKTILTIETMPQSIRDWLGSDNLTFLIIDINKRLGFKNWKRAVIPQLVLELATKELAPENFIAKLSTGLEISFSAARILTEEIIEKALRPIEKNLRTELDVDIYKILTAEMPPVAAKITPPPVIEKMETEREISDMPFVIHEETPTFKVPVKITPVRPPAGGSPQALRQSSGQALAKPKPTPPPIPAKAPAPTVVRQSSPQALRQSSGQAIKETKMLPKTTHQNSHRVVHYSNLISPL